MKKYRVLLTRDFLVEIRAKNKTEAKECSEFFISSGIDESSENHRAKYKFKIERIKLICNEAFEIEEIKNG